MPKNWIGNNTDEIWMEGGKEESARSIDTKNR